jgi:hypothetical protein
MRGTYQKIPMTHPDGPPGSDLPFADSSDQHYPLATLDASLFEGEAPRVLLAEGRADGTGRLELIGSRPAAMCPIKEPTAYSAQPLLPSPAAARDLRAAVRVLGWI